MKTKRYLLPLAITLAFVGCVSLLAYGVRAVRAGRSSANNATLRSIESDTLRRTQDSLSQLLSSHQALALEQNRLVQESGQLAAEHEVLTQRLDEVTHELHQLYKTVSADSRPQKLPKNWHDRLIDQNRETYTAIHQMLTSLTEDEFPTTRTWYGDAWRKLIKPFVDGQFPTQPQRDQLVKLLDEIMISERHRVAALEGQGTTVPVMTSRNTVPAGYCLGPAWEKLAQNLRSLSY